MSALLPKKTVREIEKFLEACKDNPRWGVETLLYIRDKSFNIRPFIFNKTQELYYKQRTHRDIILKARKEGMTTLVAALFFIDTISNEYRESIMMAHDLESTAMIFEIVKLYYDKLPETLQTYLGLARTNKRELVFANTHSKFTIGTGGSKSFGRGLTPSNVHISELAFWENAREIMTAILASVPDQGYITIESTPHGRGNYYHSLWVGSENGDNDFIPFFAPWHIHAEYRDEITEEEKSAFEEWKEERCRIKAAFAALESA